ncbi:MAG: aspartate carbamoyltransferase catalytic subunit [Deltaproteobacteria bacterium]|nr:aspartate carbamoyltransferase catalytic subunit [Deltaproteobacteria bacterium]
MSPLKCPSRHLLGIELLSAEEILRILEHARELRQRGIDPDLGAAMRGRSLVTLFYEASTRTRASFEIAAQRLGAQVVSLASAASSVSKGESLWDTGRTLAAMEPAVIVCRHSSAGACDLLARAVESVSDVPAVVNAGDGAHEHPTQALLDTLTLVDHLGSLEGRTIAIVGDIEHSRVARSNLHLLPKLGATVLLAGPRSLVPAALETLGPRIEIVRDIDATIERADAIMMLRVQFERLSGPPPFPSLGDYARRYGLNQARAARMKPSAFVMHPGPMNRGIEIEPEVADGPTSVVAHQVTNGIAVRMAVLERAVGVGPWATRAREPAARKERALS